MVCCLQNFNCAGQIISDFWNILSIILHSPNTEEGFDWNDRIGQSTLCQVAATVVTTGEY